LRELHLIASENPSVLNEIVGIMKARPVLLGTIKKPQAEEASYVLKKPREIVIVNDEQIFQPFAHSIVAAPRNISRELEGDNAFCFLRTHR
jgi:hypothetical protein